MGNSHEIEREENRLEHKLTKTTQIYNNAAYKEHKFTNTRSQTRAVFQNDY